MRKTPQPLHYRLPRARLYFDDIEELFSILKGQNRKVEITAGERAVESLDDLYGEFRDQTLHEISFFVEKPHLHVNFEPEALIVHAQNDDDLSVGITQKVLWLLEKKRGGFDFVYNVYAYIAFVAFFGCILSVGMFLSRKLSLPEAYIPVLLVLSVVYLAIAYVWARENVLVKKYNSIFIARRNEREGFLQRKKDLVILAVLAASLGILFMAVMNGLGI